MNASIQLELQYVQQEVENKTEISDKYAALGRGRSTKSHPSYADRHRWQSVFNAYVWVDTVTLRSISPHVNE